MLTHDACAHLSQRRADARAVVARRRFCLVLRCIDTCCYQAFHSLTGFCCGFFTISEIVILSLVPSIGRVLSVIAIFRQLP